MITSIVRKVQGMLRAAQRDDVAVEIVFPVSPEAITTDKQQQQVGSLRGVRVAGVREQRWWWCGVCVWGGGTSSSSLERNSRAAVRCVPSLALEACRRSGLHCGHWPTALLRGSNLCMPDVATAAAPTRCAG